MNDPHVEALYFRFKTEDPTDDYSDAEPFSTVFGIFDVQLKNQELVARPQCHFSTLGEAKEALNPYLATWEQTAALDPGRYRIRFEFDRADVIDRDPTPGVIEVQGAVMAVSSMNATLTRGLKTFPRPGEGFEPSDLTRTMVSRFRDAQDGREGLTAMAYWALTCIAKEYGGIGGRRLRRASKILKVDFEVLRKLSELTSDVDDPVKGRKAGGRQNRPLTKKELIWIERVIARAITRVGEHNHDPNNLTRVGFDDFPPI